MSRPARATIDLQALAHNLGIARQHAANAQLLAVIKADGYGHGMLRVAHVLNTADGFAVASIDEAIELREGGVSQPILLLEGAFHADELALIRGYQLQIVVHNPEQLTMLEQAPAGKPLDCWVKLDTGMHRLGFAPAQLAEIHARLDNCDNVAVISLMTHFACADTPAHAMNAQQLQTFNAVCGNYDLPCSLANSAALLSMPASHADWVRPGIMLYGSSPLRDTDAASLGLRPVMTLRSELIAVQQCQAGDSVGYGADWQCDEAMRIGIVAIGYGDGYPRHAPSGTPVLVDGRRSQLVGRVSMDMIAVDLRDCPDAAVGSAVVLWGEGLPADEVARHAGTIAYELFCNVAPRVPRREV